jgi:hypothetical protein
MPSLDTSHKNEKKKGNVPDSSLKIIGVDKICSYNPVLRSTENLPTCSSMQSTVADAIQVPM